MRVHVKDTYNIWAKHLASCEMCKRSFEKTEGAYVECLEGLNTQDEFIIASSKLGAALRAQE